MLPLDEMLLPGTPGLCRWKRKWSQPDQEFKAETCLLMLTYGRNIHFAHAQLIDLRNVNAVNALSNLFFTAFD